MEKSSDNEELYKYVRYAGLALVLISLPLAMVGAYAMGRGFSNNDWEVLGILAPILALSGLGVGLWADPEFLSSEEEK
jgi:hypothetical protein